ncbi:hypothetical protein [Catellatospora sp. IY07-71]|uniref:hypothetical protein n=1 Tax=Catellatospora sp. IY07-71 TaxID=2728827 RepID=UPI001BB31E91|nr:hypothetical protein [Catellatospora sp. IY07-71]
MDGRATTGTLRSARIILWLQFALVAVFVVGAVLPLLSAAIGTGDPAGLADPGLERYGDPKDRMPVPGPDSVYNPLWWIVLACYAAVLTGAVIPLGVLAAAAGAYPLARHHRDLTRRVRAWLVAGTLASAAIPLLLVTPYGAQLRLWLRD